MKLFYPTEGDRVISVCSNAFGRAEGMGAGEN